MTTVILATIDRLVTAGESPLVALVRPSRRAAHTLNSPYNL